MPPAFELEPVAAMGGRDDNDGVGLFIAGGAFWSGARAKLASVPMLEADMLRAGDAGRAAGVKGDCEGFAGGALLDTDGGRDNTAGAGGGGAFTELAEVAVGVA